MTDNSSGSILVTGGAGYIGSHAIISLREAGYRCVVVDDLSTGQRDLVPKDVPLIIGDVGDQCLVAKTIQNHGCYGVMHFAGSIIVPESVLNPVKYYSNNTVKSLSLLECCANEGIEAFIFSSTAAVYGDQTEYLVTEDAETNPVNPYGRSKLITEWMLRDIAATSSLCYAILRYFNVAGADPKGRSGQTGPNTTHLIRVACEVAAGKRLEMSLFGDDYETPDGTCIRDFIHVSDLAGAHVLALEHLLNKRGNLLLNCGYGHGFSVREVLDVVEEFSHRPVTIHTVGRRQGDAAVLVSDSRKIRETLGWSPKLDDLRTIVRTALEWEQNVGVRIDDQ